MSTFKLIEGKLQPSIDICVTHAKNVYRQRKDIDTNPMIVQMINMDRPIPHWYYRSDQWIDQPYYQPSTYLQPYVGPTDQAEPYLFGEGTYQLDKDLMDFMTSDDTHL